MFIDSRFLFNTSLVLPGEVFPFGAITLKALPYIAAVELFKHFDGKLFEVELLQAFLSDEEKIEDWMNLKKAVDPSSKWTYNCLICTLALDVKRKGFIEDVYITFKARKIFKKYSSLELFRALSLLNGTLVYLDSTLNEKTVSFDRSLDLAKSQLDMFNNLRNLGLYDIDYRDFLEKFSFLQVRIFNQLARVKRLEELFTLGLGLSEEGKRDVNNQIEDLLKMNCEKKYLYKKKAPIWHGYFTDEDLKEPFTEKKEEYLKGRCGQNSLIYKQYLKDKEKSLELNRAV